MATNQQFPDAATAAPDIYPVLPDHERARVLEVRMAPGVESPLHFHPQSIAYFITPASLRISLPDGSSVDLAITARRATVQDAAAHSGVNAGDNEIHAIMIELK